MLHGSDCGAEQHARSSRLPLWARSDQFAFPGSASFGSLGSRLLWAAQSGLLWATSVGFLWTTPVVFLWTTPVGYLRAAPELFPFVKHQLHALSTERFPKAPSQSPRGYPTYFPLGSTAEFSTVPRSEYPQLAYLRSDGTLSQTVDPNSPHPAMTPSRGIGSQGTAAPKLSGRHRRSLGEVVIRKANG